MNLQYVILFLMVCLILVMAGFAIPEGSGMAYFAVFIAGVVVGAFATGTEARKRYEKTLEKMISEDEAKFAMVVKEFYQNDPVLTTGVWKKVHPQIIPPWHQGVPQQSEEK